MKRKTNLFYTTGPDSKFLTFSNYTEALTGNFLSTDTKLFPDKFLCLRIEGLNDKGDNNINISKKLFIKYLVDYYENKLASLRDFCVSENNSSNIAEKKMLPLAYLLEAIVQVCQYSSDTHNWKFNPEYIESFNTKNFTDNERLGNIITYVGDITEQDFNGTYTDTICSINANEYNIGTIISNKTRDTTETYSEESPETLHGWTKDEIIFDDYKDDVPLFDDIVDDNMFTYYFNSFINRIEISHKTELENVENILEFNVIIPLFSITNMNYNTNTNSIVENNEIKLQNDQIDDASGDYCDRIHVPLGIWIYTDDTTNSDAFIQLRKDTEMDMYPSWSLLISSQFKPFPYSLNKKIYNESQSGIMPAYPTFAETLSKINTVLDKFNTINSNINKMNERIDLLEQRINKIGTTDGYSKLENTMLQFTIDIKNEISEFKKQMYGYIDNITWSSNYNNKN